MPQIVWTARPDGSCDYLNAPLRGVHGRPGSRDARGGLAVVSCTPTTATRTQTRWMADVETGSDHDIESASGPPTARYRWFKTRGLPVRDESGQVVKWFGTCTDIDDQKRAEELRQARGGGRAPGGSWAATWALP